MFGIIDRYLSRNFLYSYVVLLGITLGLFVLFDTFGHFDNILETELPFKQLLRSWIEYHSLQVPQTFCHVNAPVVLMAAMFALTSLNRNNEITPLKACGMSIYRVVWPLFLLGFVAGLASVAVQELVLPRISARLFVLTKSVRQHHDQIDIVEKTDYTDTFGVQLIGYKYSVSKKTLIEPVARQERDGSATIVTAEWAEWRKDPEDRIRKWFFHNGREYRIDADHRDLPGFPRRFVDSEEQLKTEGGAIPTDVHYVVGPYVVEPRSQMGLASEQDPFRIYTDIQPHQLMLDRLLDENPSTAQLLTLARENPQEIDVAVELHKRFVAPANAIVLLLLGLPFALRNTRGLFTSLGVCVLLTSGYLFVSLVCTTLVVNGKLTPPAGAWLPVIIFGLIGVALFENVGT